MSGYFNACLKELAKEVSDLILVRQKTNPIEAPFEEVNFAWLSKQFDCFLEVERAKRAIAEQAPDILIVAGWLHKDYTSIAKMYKSKKTFVVGTCDNTWRGNNRQKLASLTSKFHVKSYFDYLWVPGQKAADFAENLGFSPHQIIRGLYTCDVEQFQKVYKERTQKTGLPKTFLYAGRYIETKGIKTLLQAYEIYQKLCTSTPWPLWFSGSGSLETLVNSSLGVKNYGFTQPEKLPDLFSQVGVLVLPSSYEPWGVVVHEATSAGLPVICTNACGSSVELVKDNCNGFIIPPNNPMLLAESLNKMAAKSACSIAEFSQKSYQLSQLFTPTIWVNNLISAYEIYRRIQP